MYTKGEEVCKGQQKMEGYSRKTPICKHFRLTKTTGWWGWTTTSSHWLYLNHSHLIIFYVQFHHSLSLLVCIPTPIIPNSFYFIRFPSPPWHTVIPWQAWTLIILLVQMFEVFKEILLFLFSKELKFCPRKLERIFWQYSRIFYFSNMESSKLI
jgi:hypothetical protein